MDFSRVVFWISLATVLLLLILGWNEIRENSEEHAIRKFEITTQHEVDILKKRLKEYERVLRGAAGLYYSSNDITRDEWRKYYQSLQLDLSLPGIQALGFSKIFPKDKLPAIENELHSTGYPEFSVYPVGDRETYSAIVFIEPFDDRNSAAFGYDMYSNPVRRVAMQRAIKTGLPSWSKSVTLVQEIDDDIQKGVLVYLPVYNKGELARSEVERQNAIYGFSYSAFRIKDMMSKIFDQRQKTFDLQLYEDEIAKDKLLFSSGDSFESAKLTEIYNIHFGGVKWIAMFTNNSTFFDNDGDFLENWLLGLGVLVVLLVAAGIIIDDHKRKQLSKLNHSMEKRFQDSIIMAELTEMLQSCSHIEDAYPIIAQSMQNLLPNLSGACYILNNSETLFIQQQVWGNKTLFTETFHQHDCWSIKRSTIHNSFDKNLIETPCNHFTNNASGLCIPLLSQGKLIGVLSFSLSPHQIQQIPKHDIELITSASDMISLALANLQLRVELHDLSMRDALTGLYNRRFIEECIQREIDRASRSSSSLIIVMADLDHFKHINDNYGHDAGDAVLKSISQLFIGFRNGYDIVSRYGGEEFLFLLTDISQENAFKRLEELRLQIEDMKVETGGHVIDSLSISIGAATFPEMGTEKEILINRADEAMYFAKNNGRNQIAFYTPKQ